MRRIQGKDPCGQSVHFCLPQSCPQGFKQESLGPFLGGGERKLLATPQHPLVSVEPTHPLESSAALCSWHSDLTPAGESPRPAVGRTTHQFPFGSGEPGWSPLTLEALWKENKKGVLHRVHPWLTLLHLGGAGLLATPEGGGGGEGDDTRVGRDWRQTPGDHFVDCG